MSLTKKLLKPPKQSMTLYNKTKSFLNFAFSQKLLYNKYSKKDYNYTYINTTYLIFNEKCRIVSIFKDYLIYDDSTEFLRRFYNKNEITQRLIKIYNFYETYSKIFPNYMILPENLYLYRNIRKKQKMIDAFNDIKREEEENRKNLNLGISSNKQKKNVLTIFDKSIQESINKYQPSISKSILSNTNKNSIEESKSTLSLSLYNKPINNNLNTPNESFKEEYNNTTLKSIESIINKFDKNNNLNYNLFQTELITTPKRELSNNKESHIDQQNALNNNKKFICHKVAVSVEITKLKNKNENKDNNFIKNLNIEKKLNNLNLNFDNKSPSPDIKSNREKNENKFNKFTTKPYSRQVKKQNKNYFIKEIRTSEYKSPNNKDINLTNNSNSIKSKRPITTTIKTTTHMMPFYKNKILEGKHLNSNISDSMNTISGISSKINPLKTKLEKKKLNIKNHNTLNISNNKKTFISSFNSNNPNEIKKTLFNEINKDITNHYDSNQYSNNTNQKDSSTTVNTGNENNTNVNNNSKDMKDKYKNFIEKNKIIRNSYDPESNIFHRFHTQNNVSINTNKNIGLKSQRRIKNMKGSNERKIITSPNLRIPLTTIQNKIKIENNFNNHIYTPVNKTFKLNLNLKDKIGEKDRINNNKNVINNLNFKMVDGNTKKMKFIKK